MRRVIIFSYTEAGRKLNSEAEDYLIKQGDVVISCCYGKNSDVMLPDSDGVMAGNEKNIMSTDKVLQREWCRTDAFVFIGAMGIAVRHVAPLLENKIYDPAVLVLDEKGQFVIPVVSGHIGGGVALARELAKMTGGQAVITTATDVEERFAVDVFACKNHLWIEKPGSIKVVSSALLQGRTVEVWTTLPIDGKTPAGVRVLEIEETAAEEAAGQKRAAAVPPVITIGLSQQEQEGVCRNYDPSQMCILKPRPYILGIGCKKGKTAEELEAFLQRICKAQNIEPYEIGAVASIDVKRQEPGIWELASRLRADFEVFSADELAQVEEVVAASDFVKETVGVDNVCERSAYCLAKRRTLESSLAEAGKHKEPYSLVLGKQAQDGMTMAIVKAEPRLVW